MLGNKPGSEAEEKLHVDYVEFDGVEDCRDEGGIHNELDTEVGAAVQKKREINFIAVRKLMNSSAYDEDSDDLEYLPNTGRSGVRQCSMSLDGAEKRCEVKTTASV